MNFEARVQKAFDERYDALARKTDQLFGYLLVFQWAMGVVFALWLSPTTWAGASSQVHFHIYSAIFLGGALVAYPLYAIFNSPGNPSNRIVIAISQILFSVLFIHLTGGRIETHFHIFGSLAFLAFYRDWRVVFVATLITAVDHFIRGAFWPESVYGVLTSTPWRALEHSAWVAFEDIFLFYSINLARTELKSICESQVTLEDRSKALQRAHDTVGELNLSLEKKVEERTRELRDSQQMVLSQQQALLVSSKMSALGEMAGEVAQEINTPLAIIGMRVEQLEECIRSKKCSDDDFLEVLGVVKKTVGRIAKTVSGLKFFAREEKHGINQKTKLSELLDETLGFCREKFKSNGIKLDVVENKALQESEIECQSVEISQVLLNLLNNAFDAVDKLDSKWVTVQVDDLGTSIELAITDSGTGIPKEILGQMMNPFFTTKEVGKGTGLGLSISKGIIEEHHGRLYVDQENPNTRLVISLPKKQMKLDPISPEVFKTEIPKSA